MKKVGNTLLAFVFIFGLSACLKDVESSFEIKGDAYVLKRVIEGDSQYATAFYVFANKAMSSATVTKPNSISVSLEPSPENSFTFLNEPAKNDFTSDLPIIGDYQFEILSVDDELVQTTDFLEFEDLSVPVINKSDYDSESQFLEVSWDPVPGAEGFAVKITKLDGEIIFISFSLDWDVIEYPISISAGSWTESPSFETNYILEVHAFTFESDSDAENYVYNLTLY